MASELANSKTCLEEDQDCNKRAITDLYKAFLSNDTHTLHRLLAPDLEWWFHGPPCHRHYLIPLLTGSSSSSQKPLIPDIIVGFGSVTVAEGYDEANMVWWVHAWTIVDGTITELREYVNTSVTVTRLGYAPKLSSQIVAASKCQCIWQSKLCDGSVPGLILAI